MIIFDQLGKLGRLGNSMFQIAATITHAKKTGDVPLFNKWEYNDYFLNKIDDSLITLGASLVHGIYHELVNHTTYHYEQIDGGKNIALLGYFESEKYFDTDLVLKQFIPNDKLMDMIKYAGNSRMHTTNLCAVHIRRQDCLTNPKHLPLKLSYYHHAMKYIKRKLPDVKFMLFSDDIPWCRAKFGQECYYSEHNRDIVDMFLIAQCQHVILANSTFSWWGAWLGRMFNDIKKKIIIVPKEKDWFGPASDHDVKDLYCEGWVRI